MPREQLLRFMLKGSGFVGLRVDTNLVEILMNVHLHVRRSLEFLFNYDIASPRIKGNLGKLLCGGGQEMPSAWNLQVGFGYV